MLTRRTSRATIALVLVLSSCRTGGEPTTPPAPAVNVPTPPPDPVVELTDLIPPQASVALLVEVGALRRSNHGPALIGLVRRLAETQAFEQQAEIDLASNVERLLIFSEVDPERGARGDLADITNRIMVRSGGMVLELAPTLSSSQSLCRQSDLAGVQMRPVQGPMENMAVGRCGQLVLTSCCTPEPARLSRQSSPAARALERAPEPVAGAERVAAVVMGPDALNRASCERSVVPLTGWHSAVADFGAGVTVRGRLHAASPNDAPALRQCVEDGISEVVSLPLVQQFGIGGLFSSLEVTQDPADEKDVLVTIPLDEQQTEFIMSLVDLVAGGAAP
jgi:hypothetical protein